MYTLKCEECQKLFQSVYLSYLHEGVRKRRRYCSRKCAMDVHGREATARRLKKIVPADPNFYIKLLMPEHPRGQVNGYVDEHIILAEQALGKYLPPKAEVHHVDRNRQNNSLGNLVICENKKYHRLLHAREDRLNDTGSLDMKRCCCCHAVKSLDQFNSNVVSWDNLSAVCKSCRAIKRKEYRAARISAY